MKPFARMILVSSLALAAGCASTLKVANAPVAALDLNRYLGEWYAIARFAHSPTAHTISTHHTVLSAG